MEVEKKNTGFDYTDLKIKVCGMRDKNNILDLIDKVSPDYIGFIFYEKSPRHALKLDADFVKGLEGVLKVGVFVNEGKAFVLNMVKEYGLDLVQLHGDESPAFCQQLKEKGIKITKAIPVKKHLYPSQLREYQNYVDYFLFDTKGDQRGGNGQAFDWSVLKTYDLKVPFFVAGGVSVSNLMDLKLLEGSSLHAIDVNSKFETKPGFKETEKLKELKNKLSDLIKV